MSQKKIEKMIEVRELAEILCDLIKSAIPDNENDPLLQLNSEELIEMALKIHKMEVGK